MKFQIKNRYTGAVIAEGEAESFREFVESEVQKGTRLSRANLSGANLGAIKADFLNKLTLAKSEVAELFRALLDGRIDGSLYSGECACFVGTIANIRGSNPEALESEIGLEMDTSSPTERWFLAIRKGDTPENNPVSKITAEWISEWAKVNGVNLPTRKMESVET